jgi:hypothetical protein
MALFSRAITIGNAIVTILNADPDLATYDFVFQKKPYNRTNPDLDFGVVSLPQVMVRDFENEEEEISFQFKVSISRPADGDLTSGIEDQCGAIERVADLFRNRAGRYLPTALKVTAQNAMNAATTSGYIASTAIEKTTSQITGMFVDGAFEAGYDSSSCVVTVICRATRI